MSEKGQPKKATLLFFLVNAEKRQPNEGIGTAQDFPVGVNEFTEEQARRWLIGHFLRTGWSCKKIRRISPDELPDGAKVSVLPHIPGESD